MVEIGSQVIYDITHEAVSATASRVVAKCTLVAADLLTQATCSVIALTSEGVDVATRTAEDESYGRAKIRMIKLLSFRQKLRLLCSECGEEPDLEDNCPDILVCDGWEDDK